MKRPISALLMPDVAPMQPATAAPVFMTVRPEELLVDESYQRDLSDASIRLIRKIVAEWDWRKFKAPVVAMTEEGPVVIDGQHTATAAASHPAIDEIPVLVVEATDRQAQAEAFVGINTTRLGITAAQLHHANVTAGDPLAITIERVCREAGVKVLRLPPARAVYKPGETIAVAAISGLVSRSGETTATRVLSILSGAGIGPVQAAHIRAVELLLTDEEFADLDGDDLGRIITAAGLDAAEKEARVFASTHCVPLWRALAATWFKARRARKTARNMPGNIPEGHISKAPAVAEMPAQPEPKSAPICQPDEGIHREVTLINRETLARHKAAIANAKTAVPAPNFSGPGRR